MTGPWDCRERRDLTGENGRGEINKYKINATASIDVTKNRRLLAGLEMYPCTSVCVYHTLLGRFCTAVGIVPPVPKRRWKHVAGSVPKTCRWVSAPSWLSSDRAGKPPAPGVYGAHRLIRVRSALFEHCSDLVAPGVWSVSYTHLTLPTIYSV